MNSPTEETVAFTPIFDTVVKQFGRTTAYVYGAVWRRCQMRERLCRASQHTLAGSLGLSVGTVNREIRKLLAAGYIEDLTPAVRRAPHAYRDTGRAMQIAAQACTPDVAADRATVPSAPANPPQPHAAVPQVNASVPPVNTSVPQLNTTVSLAHSKILLRDSRRDSRERAAGARSVALQPGTAAAPPSPDPALLLFREVTGFLPPRMLHDDVRSALRSIEQRLGHAAQAADVAPYFKAWIGHGWRPANLAWLFEWAVSGEIPEKGPTHASHSWSAQSTAEKARAGAAGATYPPAVHPSALSPEERERLVRLYNPERYPDPVPDLPR